MKRKPMSNGENSAAVEGSLDGALDQVVRLHVNRGRCLVQQEDLVSNQGNNLFIHEIACVNIHTYLIGSVTSIEPSFLSDQRKDESRKRFIF